MRRTLLGAVLTAGWLLAATAPALADAAGPTNYRSRITAVETADGEPVAVEAEVLGGDAFLVLRVPEGTAVEVPGYDDEPYLRFRADGSVEVNRRSPTHWLNEDRYGAEVPDLAGASAEPVWRTVAADGTYAWHDHRIHWMSPSPPPRLDTAAASAQPVFDWEVPLRVDGQSAVVRGELTWRSGPPPWVPAAIVGAALAAVAALVHAAGLSPALVGAVVALFAGAAGLLMAAGQPPGGEGDVSVVVLPALSLVVALLSLLRRAGGRGAGAGAARGTRALAAAAAVPLLAWGLLQFGALTRPIVPEPLPTGALRAVVAAALAAGAVGLVELARAALPGPLDGEDEAGTGDGEGEPGTGDGEGEAETGDGEVS